MAHREPENRGATTVDQVDEPAAEPEARPSGVVEARVPRTRVSSMLRADGARRFEDTGVLARGGMGTIHRVYDRRLRREVAMKVSDPSSATYDEAALRFVEEAQITGQLDHPNIVPVHDLGEGGVGGSGVQFTMKLVDGETLTAFIERLHVEERSQRGIERALQVFAKICDAVSFAHSRGVVHRDLKPDNVMVGSHGQVYVMDWGVAVLLDADDRGAPRSTRVTVSEDVDGTERDESGAIVGTFEFMAPEQAWGRGDEVDERTDVFGLGGLLYFLLTGVGPNAADSAVKSLQVAQKANHPAPASRAAWPELPPGLCAITMTALSRRREDRFQSVEELKVAIEDFGRGGGWFATRTYDSGDVLVREGDAGDAAFIITRGTCEVFKGEGESRRLLRRMGEGDVFGETAILTGEVRSATVVAVDEVHVKVVTRDALERELGRQSWGGAFVRTLAARFREADEKLSRLRRESGE